MILSIITVSLNSEKYLEQCLKSSIKLCSLGDDIEHILYDGGSSDNTCEIGKSFSHVKLFENGSREGVYNAFNKAAELAQGYYIIYLNSDDFLNDELDFTDIVNLLRLKNHIWLTGHLNWVDRDNKLIISDKPNRNMSFSRFLISNTIRHPATFVQRDYLINNKYEPWFKYAADYKFFLDLWSKGNTPFIIKEKISNFRIWESSLSTSFRASMNNEFLVRMNWRLENNFGIIFLLSDLFIFNARLILLNLRMKIRYRSI